MKKTLSALASILVAATLSAQTYTWSGNCGATTSMVEGRSVATDMASNFYATGYFTGFPDLDPGIASLMQLSNGMNDIFVQKFDNTNTHVWSFAIGGTGEDKAYAIDADNNGNVYICGSFSGTVDFDPDANVFNVTSAGGLDAFVAKYDVNGDLVWVRTSGGTNDEEALSVSAEGTGAVVISCGYFSGSGDFNPDAGVTILTSAGLDDAYVQRINGSTGNFMWAGSAGGTGSDRATAVVVNQNLAVYATGYFEGNADLDFGALSNNHTSNGGRDAFVACINVLDGSTSGVLQLGGTGNDEGSAITVEDAAVNAAQVFVTGTFFNTVNFNPLSIALNKTSNGLSDAFVACYDPNFMPVWVNAFGGTSDEIPYAITRDANGKVYTTGDFMSTTIDLDPGAGTNIHSNGAQQNTYVQQLLTNGNFGWGATIETASFISGTGLAADQNGCIIGCGSYQQVADFDPGSMNQFTTCDGPLDQFLYKWSTCAGTYDTLNIVTCTPYTLMNTTYSSSGTYNVLTTNANGCDSLITLNLNIQTTMGLLTLYGCDVVTVNSVDYFTNGAYLQTLPGANQFGCDSNITINVYINTVVTTVTQNGQTLTVDESLPNIASIHWINCSTNTALPNSGNPSFTPSASGTYAAVITTTDGCTDTTVCTNVTIQGIEEQHASAINLFPNPANEEIILNCSINGRMTVEILDVSGAVTSSSTYANANGVRMNVSMLAAGIYFVRVSGDSGQAISKFIKE